MIKLEVMGADALRTALKARVEQAKRDGRTVGVVGYSAPYAVHVHEDLEAQHPNGGQAKFLEEPARTRRVEVGATVRRLVDAGATFEQAFRVALEQLLGWSRQLVPVDTGRLRDSGFVEVTVE